MSKEQNGLVGKDVQFFTDGGWEITGKVQIDNKELYVINAKSDGMCIVYKSKVCIARIVENEKSQTQDTNSDITHKPVIDRANNSQTFGSTTNYGSFLPADMLKEGEKVDDDDEFGVFFGSPISK